MSFNLNKLVQPECGGSNPLVSAAHQIARIPTTNLATIRPIQGSANAINFAKEFIQQNAAAQLSNLNQRGPSSHMMSGPRMSQQINGGRFATDFLREHELIKSVDKLQISGHHQVVAPSTSRAGTYMPTMLNQSTYRVGAPSNLMSQTTIKHNSAAGTAGEQLETKYRNDMISQSSMQQKSEGKVDDVEFWQSLSQSYIGPSTTAYAEAQMRAGPSNQQETTSGVKDVDTQAEAMDKDAMDDMMTDEHDWFPSEKAEPSPLEYTFDERNPLKDQFEDPFAEGLKKLEEGDIPSAALLFEAAVQKEPENSTAWRYLGTTQAQNEKDNSAIRALKNCLNLDKNDQQARLALSVSLANETQHRESCECLLEWLINHDKYRAVGASLDEYRKINAESENSPYFAYAIDEQHHKYVRDKFVEAARMSPNNPDPEVQSALGVLFNIYGEYEKAVDCFKAALSVRSEDSLLWNRLGATLANGNKSDDAVIAYRKALELSPGFLRSRYNLAISLIHLNTYDEAAKQLVQILNMQAAGKGSKNVQIRTRSITSTAIWNTLRTVSTLMNRPDLYSVIDGRDLDRCNEEFFKAKPSSAAD